MIRITSYNVCYTKLLRAYLFDNLDPGDYYLVFSDLPSGHVVALKDQGGNDNLDSDANLVAPYRTTTTTLTSNEDDMSWDAGIYVPASLGIV